ncbi:hypothetical protein [Maridesulfovibrio ferrireducens]|uniref:hypothetical protein n=1 Tax=Maridesulfovibrio ferrireducens TaxID=246191 RepID=UPI001A2AD750|nr:hypothetical protein [Maridesulfovibrio ferrireducens]MBI9110020.1 hypothetical protein [Maridesulfovibrio ferrireducens]
MSGNNIERKQIPETDYEMDREGRVFKITTSPGYPCGFQKKPTMHRGMICYSFESGVISKDIRKFYFELFEVWPVFPTNEDYFKKIIEEADINNLRLKGVRRGQSRNLFQRMRPSLKLRTYQAGEFAALRRRKSTGWKRCPVTRQ